MNPAKCTAEDYINFIIATPRVVTAIEAERVQPISENAPAHDAFTRLLTRLEPDSQTRWSAGRSISRAAFSVWTIRLWKSLIPKGTIWFIGIGRARRSRLSPALI